MLRYPLFLPRYKEKVACTLAEELETAHRKLFCPDSRTAMLHKPGKPSLVNGLGAKSGTSLKVETSSVIGNLRNRGERPRTAQLIN